MIFRLPRSANAGRTSETIRLDGHGLLSRELYEKMSPFNKVANVVTPTLILCGEHDWNVPVINSEQLYLALKRLGVPTELVVYPGEYHGIYTPTYIKDRYERYLDWFDHYIKGKERKKMSTDQEGS